MGSWARDARLLRTPHETARERKKAREMAFTYSKEDISRTRLVDSPTWLPVRITNYQEKIAKSDKRAGAINHVITVKVEEAGNEYEGLVHDQTFPEEYPSLAFDFLNAMGVNLDKDGGIVRFEEFKGKDVFVCLGPGTYNNKPNNQVLGWRPIDWSPNS